MKMLNLPQKVYFKHGSMNVALRELSEVYCLKRAFLVSDPATYLSGTVTQIDNWIRKQGIRTAEFFSIGNVPSFEDIHSALPKLLEFEPDVIVGIGGNGAMSAAKAMWALYENPELDFAQVMAQPEQIMTGKKAKLALVATTFDSGAQNSPYSILKDDSGALCVLNSFQLLPQISVTDAQFVTGLKPEEIKAQGLATLSNAIRAYQANGDQDYPKGLLESAISTILKELPEAVKGSPAAIEKLHNAASLAGATYGNIPYIPDLEAPAYPTEEEKLEGKEWLEQLVKNVGFEDVSAFWSACEQNNN